MRNPTIVLTSEVTSIPLDALKGITKKIEEIEKEIDNGATFTDLTDGTIIVTGTTPYKVHVFQATTVFATGTYTIEYAETVPNVDLRTNGIPSV